VGCWILFTLTATSQFVVSYAVAVWYFTPYERDHQGTEHKRAPRCALLRGYWHAIFHFGSLAFGGLIISIFFLFRGFLGLVAQAAETQGNTVLEILARCCLCCVTCWQRCFQFLNKNAYMDIAINSTTFCTGARNAVKVIMEVLPTVGALHGSTWVLKISGWLLITSSGTWLMWILVRNLWWFNNVESSWYVNDPVTVCFLAALVCFVIAVGFMIVFDMVADTVLYCYATELRRKQRGQILPGVHYAPPSLNNLLHGKSHDDDHEFDSLSKASDSTDLRPGEGGSY
jgi:hypothetical protein